MSTAAGAVPVKAPRSTTDASTGPPAARFSSAILPAWARKSPQVAGVLPLVYLHGLSSTDFGRRWTSSSARKAGRPSRPTITRPSTQWQDEAAAFGMRSLAGTDYVYMWFYWGPPRLRLSQDKVCLLVMIGVRADGTKGTHRSPMASASPRESWADLLATASAAG